MVERGELRLTESLRHGENGRVDEANTQVGVGGEQLANTPVVAGQQILDLVRAAADLTEQYIYRSPVALPGREVVELDQHRRRQDPGSPGIRQQLRARRVICIVAVEGGP